jgi:predicted transcriptional regulator
MIYIIRVPKFYVKNRSRPDIMAIILESANGGISKTKLLTRANLTSEQLRQYRDILIQKKLILELTDEDRRHMAYRTTEKGIRYLLAYSTLKDIAVFQQEH